MMEETGRAYSEDQFRSNAHVSPLHTHDIATSCSSFSFRMEACRPGPMILMQRLPGQCVMHRQYLSVRHVLIGGANF